MTLHLPLEEQPDGLPVHPLGLRFAPPDPHNLLFARYATALAPPPPRKDYEHPVGSWSMYGNDRLGDCVPAGLGHATQIVTAGAVQVTDDDVLHAYEAIGGYRPGDPTTDRGCVELDAMRWWRKVGIAGHRIDAFVSVDPKNHTAVKQAIDLLGVVLYGIALPLAAQGKRAWSKPRNLAGRNAAGSWGGHAVVAGEYDAAGVTVITWGKKLRMSWGFHDAYVQEVWAPLALDWCGSGLSPSGFDLATLRSDLAAL